MPFVDILSNDDYASIFYRTNTLFGNIGGFDADKPTIIILHRTWLDSSWMHHHFEDHRLSSTYNLIAFDQRASGRSSSRASGKHDVWVDAADLAFLMMQLQLPACHILASEAAGHTALRFSALFPDLCLSLILLNIPPPTELKWLFTAYDELLQRWCFPDDLEMFEHATMESCGVMFGSEQDPDLRDELIAYWCKYSPPKARQRVLTVTNSMMNRTVLKSSTLARIECRVMIIQGERSQRCPLKYAEKLQSELVNALGGAILYTVKGADSCLSTLPSNASIANQVINKFLSRVPPAKTILRPPTTPLETRMKIALQTLAEMHEDPSMATRNPMSPLSFSCVSPEIEESQTASLEFYAKDLDSAFSPVGESGRPLRLYSEKMQQSHWFNGGDDMLSTAISDAAIAQNARREKNAERDRKSLRPRTATHGSSKTIERAIVPPEPTIPVTELISTRAAADASLQRVVKVRRETVEKIVIKGSMSKVVAANANATHLKILT